MKSALDSPVRLLPKIDRRKSSARVPAGGLSVATAPSPDCRRDLVPIGGTIAADPARVARLAFGFFLERGGEHGRHVEDWLRAERMLAVDRSCRS